MRILYLLGGLALGYGGAYYLARKRGLPGAVAFTNPTYVANGQLLGRPAIGLIYPSATTLTTTPSGTQTVTSAPAA